MTSAPRAPDGVSARAARAEPRRVPPLLFFPVRGAGRKLDAERGAGLARPAAHELALQTRPPGDAPVLAGAALFHRQWRGGRPSAEAAAAGRHPDDARVPGIAAGTP